MKHHIIVLASIALTSAVPVSQNDYNKKPIKRGLFDNIAHFPFLASSSSAHGSSSPSSSSSSSSDDHHDYEHNYDHNNGFQDYQHDTVPDFHSVSHTSHVIHHPEFHGQHHGSDFLNSYDHDNVAISYQNQHFGYKDFPTSYQSQQLFDNHLSSHDDQFNNHLNFDGGHNSLLDNSHLDAPVSGYQDYQNYGGDLGEYSHHAGLLDISDDHRVDHLLDPYSPNHSSYDSY